MSSYPSPDPPATMLPTHDVPMRHAFVIMGERTLFLCHLANWWREGQNWEMVLRVTLPEAARKKILGDRDEGEPHFLVNSRTGRLTIPDLIRRSWSLKPADRKFKGDVWKGIGSAAKPAEPDPDWVPWDGDEPLLTNVTVKVDAVIHHRHANLNLVRREHEEYVLFGAGDEAHICHSPSIEPDYEHVATLEASPSWLQADQLETGVLVSVPTVPWFPGETRCEEPPLPINQPTVVRFHGITDYRTTRWDNSPGPVQTVPRYEMTVQRNWWFSTADLNLVQPTFGQCI